MFSESIIASIRIKPNLSNSSSSSVTVLSDNLLEFAHSKEKYEFEHIFPDSSSNEGIYEELVKPMIDSSLQGINVCIFAYGQTSSGKTHTMKGSENCPGIIPIALKNIFREFESPPRRILKEIRRDTNEQGIQSIPHDFQNFNGNKRSKEFQYSSFNADTVLNSTINLVDLAGSEGISKTNAQGLRLREGSNINKSLLALSNVILKLSSKDQFVSFRESKLTRFLSPCLGGNSRTAVICTISSSPENLSESLATVKFGKSAGIVKNNISVNRNSDSTGVVENSKLADELLSQTYELTSEISRKNEIIADNKEVVQNLENEILFLKEENEMLKIELSKKTTEIENMRSSLTLIRSLKENIQDQKKNFYENVSKQEVNNQEHRIASLESQIRVKEKYITELIQDIGELRGKTRVQEEYLEKAERKIQELAKEEKSEKENVNTMNNFSPIVFSPIKSSAPSIPQETLDSLQYSMDLQGKLLRKAKELNVAEMKVAQRDQRIRELEFQLSELKDEREYSENPVKKRKLESGSQKKIMNSPSKEDLCQEIKFLRNQNSKLQLRFGKIQESEKHQIQKIRTISHENLELLAKINELQASRLLDESLSFESNIIN